MTDQAKRLPKTAEEMIDHLNNCPKFEDGIPMPGNGFYTILGMLKELAKSGNRKAKKYIETQGTAKLRRASDDYSYDCDCGKHHHYPPYVIAHQNDELIHSCECGRKNTILGLTATIGNLPEN